MIFIYLILAFVGVLVEAALSPIPIGLVFLIILGSFRAVGNLRIVFLGFIFGVLLDVWLLRPVGLTGAIYAGVILLLWLYSRKIETDRLRYLVPFCGLTVGVYSWYFYSEWKTQVVAGIIVVVIGMLIGGAGKSRYGWNGYRL